MRFVAGVLWILAGLVHQTWSEVCDVTDYHPVCAFRNYLRTFFSDCLMQLENYGLVDGKCMSLGLSRPQLKLFIFAAPGWVMVHDGPCPSQKIDINEY